MFYFIFIYNIKILFDHTLAEKWIYVFTKSNMYTIKLYAL